MAIDGVLESFKIEEKFSIYVSLLVSRKLFFISNLFIACFTDPPVPRVVPRL